MSQQFLSTYFREYPVSRASGPQTTSVLSSLAQCDADSYQEYKWLSRVCIRVFQSMLWFCAEKWNPLYLSVSRGHICGAYPDFHGFLSHAFFTMWIWLESEPHLQVLPFYSHAHPIPWLFVHSLWTLHRQYPSWFSRYPQLPQASTATTVFI
jgi:hypothetical protein